MLRKLTRKRVLLALCAIAAFAIVGAAFAYLTTDGSGSGNAAVISSTDNAGKWTVSVTPDSTHPLLPGSGTASLPFTITNASSGNEGLTNVTVALATTTDSLDSTKQDIEDANGNAVTGCYASWFNVDGASGSQSDSSAPVYSSASTQDSSTQLTLPRDLASGDVVYGTATITMSDVNANQDACEGHTPKLTVSAS